METRENFNIPEVARMTEVFPQAVITDQFIFLSGMPCTDPVSGKIESDVSKYKRSNVF